MPHTYQICYLTYMYVIWGPTHPPNLYCDTGHELFQLNWVGHSRNSEWIRMIHHRSGHQSNTPVNNFGPHSFYIILYPTWDGTFRIPGVTNPVESTLRMRPTMRPTADAGGILRKIDPFAGSE
eukprot:COSAG02_NODE_1925_length_10344_cov_49.023231_7_plen_123_part_00